MDVKKTAKAAAFVVVVSFVGLRLIVWATGKMKASTNKTVQQIGHGIAGT